MNHNRWWTRFAPLALLVAALVVIGVACGDSDEGSTPTPTAAATATATTTATPTPTPAPLTGKVTVFAASSLTDSFKAIGEAFTKAHPGVTVEFNFAASSALATQIEQAGPADVFASADQAQMQRLVDKSLIEGAPSVFARNLPVIVVPADNRAGIAAPKDLAKAGVKLVLAAPDVPIGNYARQIIDKLAADPAYGAAFKDGALGNLVSNEANVRAVLAKIELGEGDAGIVYKTDALVSGDKVKTIALPDSANVIATYPIAVVKASNNKTAAAAFVAFVRATDGQTLLRNAGFDSAQ
ncbi:MAG: molybdate ABC transporter substrate-binding protein [Dehalococcoidia bacterium]